MYHGGINISMPLRPLTHLGTRNAAISRLEAKIKGGASVADCTLLKITFLSPHRPFSTEDWSTPRAVGLLSDFLEKEGRTDLYRNLKADLLETSNNKFTERDMNESEIISSRNFLVSKIMEYGYDAASYTNEHEDAGSESIVVFRNEDILIVRQVRFDARENQILRSAELLQRSKL
jgi:hypothetical protein